jgi:hypothetical protein
VDLEGGHVHFIVTAAAHGLKVEAVSARLESLDSVRLAVVGVSDDVALANAFDLIEHHVV